MSPSVAAIQLRTLRLIDPTTCEQWGSLSAARLATDFGWFSQYRSLAEDSSRPRAPQELMRLAVDGYRRGALGIVEVATWYGQDPAELQPQLGPPASPELEEDWDSDAPLFPEPAAGPAR